MSPTRALFLPSLRAQLLLAMGLALAPGCGDKYDDDDDDDDTGSTGTEQTCTDLPRHDADDAWTNSASRLLSCIDRESDGTCPDASTLNVGELVRHSDPLCGYDGDIVCGPEEIYSDACCYEIVIDGEWCEGRPFAVNGLRRAAPAVSGDGWAAELTFDVSALSESERAVLSAWWARAAADEHASVASFARVVLELMGMSAPADLLAAATRAQADEVHHARACYSVASVLRGEAVAPGVLDVRGAVALDMHPASVLRDTLVGGAIGETLAAARARAAADVAVSPVIRDLLLRIAEDEARHAALAWKTAKWILDQHPALHGLAAEVLADATGADSGSIAGAPVGWGAQTSDAVAAVHAAAWRSVIRPCADELLRSVGPAALSA
jgi:hypothetical protein